MASRSRAEREEGARPPGRALPCGVLPPRRVAARSSPGPLEACTGLCFSAANSRSLPVSSCRCWASPGALQRLRSHGASRCCPCPGQGWPHRSRQPPVPRFWEVPRRYRAHQSGTNSRDEARLQGVPLLSSRPTRVMPLAGWCSLMLYGLGAWGVLECSSGSVRSRCFLQSNPLLLSLSSIKTLVSIIY